MTGVEIRDVGYLKWRDPLAWMETMKGTKWNNLLEHEKRTFNELANQPHTKQLARQMKGELDDAEQYTRDLGFTIGCNSVEIFIERGSLFKWKWKHNKHTLKKSHDIDIQGNIVWYVTSSEDETYRNYLVCETSDDKVIWKKETVSTQVAVKDNLCYFIKVENYFRTIELCVCNPHTGKQETIIYKESDKQRDLTLIKGCNKTLYLQSSDANDSKLWRIDGTKLIPLYIHSNTQIPLGKSIFNDDCVLIKPTPVSHWTIHGKPIQEWKVPNFKKEEPIWANIESGHILTINDGSMTIWYCDKKTEPTSVFHIKAGILLPNPWSMWENSLIQTFCVKTPSSIPCMIDILKGKIIVTRYTTDTIAKPIAFKPIEIHKYHAKSYDNASVPYVIIKEKGVKPRGQIVYVYGAYGSQTPVGWTPQQWYPLLKRKWAIVYALVRGGGDKSSEWANSARKENRIKSIEDFKSVIVASQQKNNVHAPQTVLYGRSAGGIPVGALVARYPDGNLFGAVYTESPYVDVLRTASNPDLPLTIGEYEEFGNPSRYAHHFASLLEISPIDSLPQNGAPGVFVINRVGLQDKQVFPYESFKWIQRLRGLCIKNNSPIIEPNAKYITFEKNEGHHYSSKTFTEAKATDLAILEAWLNNKLN